MKKQTIKYLWIGGIIGVVLVLGYLIFNNQENNGCEENWACGEFGACNNGVQTRTCTDLYNCGTNIIKPIEQQNCNTVTECNSANVGIRKCYSSTKYQLCLANGQWSGILSCSNSCIGQGVCS